jgi:hypothetical protein
LLTRPKEKNCAAVGIEQQAFPHATTSVFSLSTDAPGLNNSRIQIETDTMAWFRNLKIEMKFTVTDMEKW